MGPTSIPYRLKYIAFDLPYMGVLKINRVVSAVTLTGDVESIRIHFYKKFCLCKKSHPL
jgi:hypothetical protein